MKYSILQFAISHSSQIDAKSLHIYNKLRISTTVLNICPVSH